MDQIDMLNGTPQLNGNVKLKTVLTSGYFGGEAAPIKRKPAQTLHNINEEDINDRDNGTYQQYGGSLKQSSRRNNGLINQPIITHNTPSYGSAYVDYATPQAPVKQGGPLL